LRIQILHHFEIFWISTFIVFMKKKTASSNSANITKSQFFHLVTSLEENVPCVKVAGCQFLYQVHTLQWWFKILEKKLIIFDRTKHKLLTMSGKFGFVKVHILFKLFLYFFYFNHHFELHISTEMAGNGKEKWRQIK